MEQDLIVVTSVLGSVVGLLLVLVMVLFCQLSRVRREVRDLQARPAMRVQKLTLEPREGHHAFHNPAIAPDEELSKRGYSMYVGDDVESQRGTERQTGGQFVVEMAKELESRQQRHEAPPFLLHGIEDKRRTRDVAEPNNPLANQQPPQQNNNQSRHRDQNFNQYDVPRSNDQNQNYPHKNENGAQWSSSQVAKKQSMIAEIDNLNKQNSFLHNQNSQHNKKNNVRQSDTNPNFIY